jgi:hypothetical protein
MKVDGPLDVGWLGEFTLQDFTIRASFSAKSGV